ncbi:MAG TPA: cupin domain-containing protein [Devosia sp.]|nr:cupin domain-containing protein [Devosia sp.]
MKKAAVNPANKAEANLMLGSVVCLTALAGSETDGELAIIDMRCPEGAGPGPHTDPWRESFYVLEGEFEFRLEQDGALHAVRARPGDTVSIPAGLGHAFQAVSSTPARALIFSVPAGLEQFFAAAGEPTASVTPPNPPLAFDRARFEAATDRYAIRRFLPAAQPA